MTYLNMDRQVCVIKTVAYRTQTDRNLDSTHTDKKVKTEGPLILSNDIFYFKTAMIIGGPTNHKLNGRTICLAIFGHVKRAANVSFLYSSVLKREVNDTEMF